MTKRQYSLLCEKHPTKLRTFWRQEDWFRRRMHRVKPSQLEAALVSLALQKESVFPLAEHAIDTFPAMHWLCDILDQITLPPETAPRPQPVGHLSAGLPAAPDYSGFDSRIPP